MSDEYSFVPASDPYSDAPPQQDDANRQPAPAAENAAAPAPASDNPEPAKRTRGPRLFLGSSGLRESDIHRWVAPYAKPINILMKVNYAFLEVATEEEADALIANLNTEIDGRKVKAERARENDRPLGERREYGGRGGQRGGPPDMMNKPCFSCGRPGHWVRDCPDSRDADKNRCFNCLSPDHFSRACPHPRGYARRDAPLVGGPRSSSSYHRRSPSPRGRSRSPRRSRSRSRDRYDSYGAPRDYRRDDRYRDRRDDRDRGDRYNDYLPPSSAYMPPPPVSSYASHYPPPPPASSYPPSSYSHSHSHYPPAERSRSPPRRRSPEPSRY